VARILAWADAHKAATGDWPTSHSGPVWGAPGETWLVVDQALRCGRRGLPAGEGLAGLLRRERGMGERRGRPVVSDPRQAVWLRAAGLTLAEIGRELGVSRQRAHQLLQKAGAEGTG
jgi:hypothetical protein